MLVHMSEQVGSVLIGVFDRVTNSHSYAHFARADVLLLKNFAEM